MIPPARKQSLTVSPPASSGHDINLFYQIDRSCRYRPPTPIVATFSLAQFDTPSLSDALIFFFALESFQRSLSPYMMAVDS